MVGWLVGWLFGCLIVWLFGWLVGWLFGCLVGWLVGCFKARYGACMMDALRWMPLCILLVWCTLAFRINPTPYTLNPKASGLVHPCIQDQP